MNDITRCTMATAAVSVNLANDMVSAISSPGVANNAF
jgi:hypothetical protein